MILISTPPPSLPNSFAIYHNNNYKILELVPNKPVVLASWIGTEPELPSLLLNSHYDVVPAVLDHWHTDPFTPVRKDGKIYAR